METSHPGGAWPSSGPDGLHLKERLDAEVILREDVPATTLKSGQWGILHSQKARDWTPGLLYFVELAGVRYHIDAAFLLPRSEFLVRQPSVNFWVLAHRERMADPAGCFLQKPRTIEYGICPFHFESEGELLFYAQHYNLRLRDCLIGRFWPRYQ